MRLYFIRHGQTDWNVQGKIQGSYDSELNQIGIAQAQELGKKVLESNLMFSKIYSSPQKRALKTAEILSGAISVECIAVKGLEEINLGVWEGLSWKEAQEKYPKEYGIWYENRRYTRVPGGESYEDMLQRVLGTLRQIVKENSMAAKKDMTHADDKVIGIVTHSAVIMCLQCYITDTPFREMKKFNTENTAIVEIDSTKFM